jgi:hypothetical protein
MRHNRHARRKAAALARRSGTGYLDRLLCGFTPTPGQHVAMVEHEAGCTMRHGGRCTCVPDISVTGPDNGVTVIDAAGVPRRVVRQ